MCGVFESVSSCMSVCEHGYEHGRLMLLSSSFPVSLHPNFHWSWSPQKGQPSRPVGSGNRTVFSAGVSVLPSSSVLGCCGPSSGLIFYQPAISPAFHNRFLWRNSDNISRSGTNIFRLSIRKYLEIWLEKKPLISVELSVLFMTVSTDLASWMTRLFYHYQNEILVYKI